MSLTDLSPSPQIGEIADSVFAIGRSTFGEDIRYIKHLKSNYVRIDNGQLKMENSLAPLPSSNPYSALLTPHSADVLVY